MARFIKRPVLNLLSMLGPGAAGSAILSRRFAATIADHKMTSDRLNRLSPRVIRIVIDQPSSPAGPGLAVLVCTERLKSCPRTIPHLYIIAITREI